MDNATHSRTQTKTQGSDCEKQQQHSHPTQTINQTSEHADKTLTVGAVYALCWSLSGAGSAANSSNMSFHVNMCTN